MDPDGLMHGFLHKKTQEAFEHDHSSFRSEALLETLENVVLGKVVMKWVVEMYEEKVSRMVKNEEEVRALIKKDKSVFESGGTIYTMGEQELVTPMVDECCVQETSEHGSVQTEGFSTISLPSEEGAERDDGVMVDEGDLSGSVEGKYLHPSVALALPAKEAVAAEPKPEAIEEEPAVDPHKRKLSTKEYTRGKEEAKEKEEEDARRKEEQLKAEEKARLREDAQAEEARLREEEAAAVVVAAIATAADAEALEPQPATDAEPKICPLRAKHMAKSKRWMKCRSCRAAMEHMAVRLGRTKVDEEALQNLEKELVI